MIHKTMVEKLNEQLQKEFYSAYLYLSMEAYLNTLHLDGFANYFHIQTQEERDHALAFFNYINKIGGAVVLGAIQQPPSSFEGPKEVFRSALEHERLVTKSIHELMDLAQELRDHSSQVFLHWFIAEQTEEEQNMDRIWNRLKLAGNDGAGLFMIDNELAQRIYNPIIIPV